ncbi:MAG: DUF151 domain-containing protein [Candidatus Nanoarchaeia archaeon]|nr:DUF151 domain-containing protein [Candidatus Nanoarchaeia archaeon]
MSHHHIKALDIIVIWLLVIIVLGVGAYLVKNDLSFVGSFARSFDLTEDPFSTDGYVAAMVMVEGKIIKFRYQCKELETSTTAERAYSLHLLYQDRVLVRPTVYNLMYDITDHFEIKTKMIKIFRLREGIYGSDLIVEKDNKILRLDSRPSDALTLAFKAGIPVYVEKAAFDEDGKNYC